MASLKLFGGCMYCNAILKNSESDYISEDIRELTHNPFKKHDWDKNTVVSASFDNNSLSGSNFDGGYNNVKYFRIYKTLSKQPKLHKVFTTSTAKSGNIEDFMVGSLCPYTYYVYPVCVDEDGTEVIGNVLQSKPIELNDGIVRVIGLIQDEDDLDTYYIDVHNIWHFALNTSNTGFTNNMAKSYVETQHQYPKEVKGNGNYRTFSIEGLLGKYDCKTDKYIDTYDDIIEWEEFMNNGELKMVIDRRGVITLGAIDSNSFEYAERGKHEVSASFNFKQLEDIEHVDILNRQLPANPFEYDVLADREPIALNSHYTNPSMLVTPQE